MRLTVRHTTTYSFDQPVTYALQKLRLRPANSPLQEVEDWSLNIEGGAIEVSYQDHHANQVDLVSASPGVQSLVVTSQGVVTTHDKAGVLGMVYGCAPLWYFRQETPRTAPGPAILDLAQEVSDLASLHALSARILNDVPYEIGRTSAETTAEAALSAGFGVCQDHAQILIAAARAAGLPARYVSGYLLIDGQVDQDASHAWAEVHLDDIGWVGFDVSNGICPDERYVRLAIGRDAAEAAPISGLRRGQGNEELIVSLQVQQ